MNQPLAAPTGVPADTPPGAPVASRSAARLSLVRAALGQIATTARDTRSSRKRPLPKEAKSPARVRQHHVEWVDDRLSDRDRAIIASVRRVRVVTGAQLERLHFAGLSERSRARSRRLVLSRLADWRVLMRLQRRVGGVRRGSSGLVFALDSAGQWLSPRAHDLSGHLKPIRRPHTPQEIFLNHALAVSELYVGLVERARIDAFELLAFATEPDCWWPDGLGRWLRPDAYLRIANARYSDAWWLEQDMDRPDRHSESLADIRRKLLAYLDFVQRGQLGPGGVTPRVLISVTNTKRAADIAGVIERLPAPAQQMFHVTTADQAVSYMVRVLKE